VTSDPEVPVPDAVEQQRPVGEERELTEHFQPTEASEIAEQSAPPDEADPADWQEQLTTAETDADWDDEVD
jgi:hypothetical protein